MSIIILERNYNLPTKQQVINLGEVFLWSIASSVVLMRVNEISEDFNIYMYNSEIGGYEYYAVSQITGEILKEFYLIPDYDK